MQIEKQEWEFFVEADRILESNMLQLIHKGVIEWNVLMWLAESRRKINTETNHLIATLLEKAAKDLEVVAQEANDAVVVSDKPSQIEVSDEDCQHEMDKTLPLLLGYGFDEAVLVQWLALLRKEISLDANRENQLRKVDLQFARILYQASEELEDLLASSEESQSFEAGGEPHELLAEEYDEPIRIELTPAARIFSRNPKLLDNCTNSADLIARLNRTGRNERCPCGSGRKFKKCCGTVI